MWFSSFLATGFLISNVLAVPTSQHLTVHEKRHETGGLWKREYRVDGDTIMPIRIALAQRNLHRADDFLMEVSHPRSSKFAQHWTADRVAETFASSQESVDAVMAWLASNGIFSNRISRSRSGNWLRFDATVRESERLLNTEYYTFSDSEKSHRIACDAYSLPQSLKSHVDFITPTVHFDANLAPVEKRNLRKRQVSGRKNFLPPVNGLSTCEEVITPDCLRSLYNIPNNTDALCGDNSIGVVELAPGAYAQSDLDNFFLDFSPEVPVGTAPILSSINGGDAPDPIANGSNSGESDLDFQVIIPLVYPQEVAIYEVGLDKNGDNSFNDFLDAVDGSYCTYKGGDDISQGDGDFGDEKDCGVYSPTNVISISYSANEFSSTPFYEHRQCIEYLKLGLMGITVLFATGDDGVAARNPRKPNSTICYDDSGTTDGSFGHFVPQFPPSCPYITAVGATRIPEGGTVNDAEVAVTNYTSDFTGQNEFFASGGGFSDVFKLPNYQADAIAAYFASYTPSYNSNQYNNTQATRGYPDISANGFNFATVTEGISAHSYGTSASTPVVAGIITLINEERLRAGKSRVGFINPVLYANPDAMNDITEGNNPGCGTEGFAAVPGWDPVTGLGTPDYPSLLKVFMSLP